MEKETIVRHDLAYIKLYHNPRSYGWEIKLFEGKDVKDYENMIKALNELDHTMLETFAVD